MQGVTAAFWCRKNLSV